MHGHAREPADKSRGLRSKGALAGGPGGPEGVVGVLIVSNRYLWLLNLLY